VQSCESGPEKEGSTAHTHTRTISDNDGSRATLHIPPMGLHIGPALQQASALVREGGTHTLEGKDQCNRLPWTTHLWNDLLCVEWAVKPRHTHYPLTYPSSYLVESTSEVWSSYLVEANIFANERSLVIAFRCIGWSCSKHCSLLTEMKLTVVIRLAFIRIC